MCVDDVGGQRLTPSHLTRTWIAAGLLGFALTGCTGSPVDPAVEPTPQATQDEAFLAQVRDLDHGLTDEELVTEAKDACYEMETQVKTRRDLRLFLKVFAAREVVPPEQALLFMVPAMQTYCPSMERFRPPGLGTHTV